MNAFQKIFDAMGLSRVPIMPSPFSSPDPAMSVNTDGSPNDMKEKIVNVILDNVAAAPLSDTIPAALKANLLRINAFVAARMIAHDLVGVQPVVSPRAMVFRLKVEDERKQVLNDVVETKARRYKAQYNIGAEADFRFMGIVEDELSHVIAMEVLAELGVETIATLRGLAEANAVSFEDEFLWAPDTEGRPVFVGDAHLKLADAIMAQQETIVNHGGVPNSGWCVVGDSGFVILRSSGRLDEKPAAYDSLHRYVGTLGESRVFIDPYADKAAPVLIGRKETEFAAALTYAPYTIVTPYPLLGTSEPTFAFQTRYAILNQHEGVPNPYLRRIDFKKPLDAGVLSFS